MKQYHRVKEEMNILRTIRRRNANWIGHILRRNCLPSHIIQGTIRGTRRRGRRRKQLLDDLEEARRYWKLKEEAQDRTLRRTQFGRGCGPVTRQSTASLRTFVNLTEHKRPPLMSPTNFTISRNCARNIYFTILTRFGKYGTVPFPL
jgi:hypothetical protein